MNARAPCAECWGGRVGTHFAWKGCGVGPMARGGQRFVPMSSVVRCLSPLSSGTAAQEQLASEAEFMSALRACEQQGLCRRQGKQIEAR